MSGKLDQSLDDIVKTRRQTARRPGRGRGGASGARTTTSTAPPAGGVSKSARNVKQSTKAVRPLAPSGGTAESKIIVSGLVRQHHCSIRQSTYLKCFSLRTFLSHKSRYVEMVSTTCLFPQACHFSRSFKSENGLIAHQQSWPRNLLPLPGICKCSSLPPVRLTRSLGEKDEELQHGGRAKTERRFSICNSGRLASSSGIEKPLSFVHYASRI